MSEKTKVLAIGAGAIGKSISGYIFTHCGCELLYADVADPVIQDINRRGGYTIFTAKIAGALEEETIRGVRAARTDSPEAAAWAREADIISTSVGPFGLRACLPTLAGWLKERDGRPLHILLFENDADCKKTVVEGLEKELGELPAWLSVSKTSIERMTKPYSREEGTFDCLSEDFIPVILNREECTGLLAENPYFQPVADVRDYYSRKLYTNNLGHALLGYMGLHFGYHTTTEAMRDGRIYGALQALLQTTGEMMIREFGFDREEIRKHLATLELRYRNPNLQDDLVRLARDPLRKLGPGERIMGAIRLCEKNGIAIESILTVLGYAMMYEDPQDPSAVELGRRIQTGGVKEVLHNVCGIDPAESLFWEALETCRALQ